MGKFIVGMIILVSAMTVGYLIGIGILQGSMAFFTSFIISFIDWILLDIYAKL